MAIGPAARVIAIWSPAKGDCAAAVVAARENAARTVRAQTDHGSRIGSYILALSLQAQPVTGVPVAPAVRSMRRSGSTVAAAWKAVDNHGGA